MEVALVYFLILAGAFFFLIVRPQRRRVTGHRAFVASIAVGDEVITNGGIFGTVTQIGEDRVELQVAPGVVITVATAALAIFPHSPIREALMGVADYTVSRAS